MIIGRKVHFVITFVSERVKEAQDLAEEKAEKKIELLTKSIKKTKKRKRIFDQEEDEEYVSSLLLHTEEIKVQVWLTGFSLNF